MLSMSKNIKILKYIIIYYKYIKMPKRKDNLTDFYHRTNQSILNVFNPVKQAQTAERVIKSFNGPRKGIPPNLLKYLEKNGDSKIKKIIISRDPVNPVVKKALNVISFGAFEKALNELNYDNIFHLYMIVFLDNGQILRLERNEVASLKVLKSFNDKKDNIEITLDKDFTLRDMIEIASKGNEDFWIYNSKTNNCQDFIISLLNAVGLLTPEISKYVKQDAIAIFDKNPEYLSKVAKGLTDIAGAFDIIKQG